MAFIDISSTNSTSSEPTCTYVHVVRLVLSLVAARLHTGYDSRWEKDLSWVYLGFSWKLSTLQTTGLARTVYLHNYAVASILEANTMHCSMVFNTGVNAMFSGVPHKLGSLSHAQLKVNTKFKIHQGWYHYTVTLEHLSGVPATHSKMYINLSFTTQCSHYSMEA